MRSFTRLWMLCVHEVMDLEKETEAQHKAKDGNAVYCSKSSAASRPASASCTFPACRVAFPQTDVPFLQARLNSKNNFTREKNPLVKLEHKKIIYETFKSSLKYTNYKIIIIYGTAKAF